jgi:peroxiredoxin Q/BCP
MLEIGNQAPDFELTSDDGASFRLSEQWDRGPLVVYFYPKDHTPGCTVEACRFRDVADDLAERGARVVGISADSPETHQSFRARHQLNFTLLTDLDGEVAKRFGVKKSLGLFAGRATFVLERGGRVALSFSSQLRPELHVKKALEVVAKLEEKKDSPGD